MPKLPRYDWIVQIPVLVIMRSHRQGREEEGGRKPRRCRRWRRRRRDLHGVGRGRGRWGEIEISLITSVGWARGFACAAWFVTSGVHKNKRILEKKKVMTHTDFLKCGDTSYDGPLARLIILVSSYTSREINPNPPMKHIMMLVTLVWYIKHSLPPLCTYILSRTVP